MSVLRDKVSRAWWRYLHRQTLKDVARSEAMVRAAAGLEPEIRGRPDSELRNTDVDDLARFLAVAREASDRAVGLRPFDVQLLGAARMVAGQVVEMATGEGKTLSGAIAAAVYAAQGRAVHVVSVNDYLARRDAEWMGPLYERLGLTVGWIASTSSRAERKHAYAMDVTYIPVGELGFDLLRDRQCTDLAAQIVPEPDVALVDEADSVLVDEARVPLVLAGAAEGSGPEARIVEAVRLLSPDLHYETDAERRVVSLTDKGITMVEEILGGIDLYAAHEHGTTLSQINVALHAEVLLERDVHYIVRDGRVRLIDQSKGRIARLQRWPDGLQAAVEAKEGLRFSESGEILDSVTVESLLKRYRTLCGMTGTAIAAEQQLREFYGLEAWLIPPNKPCIRVDEPDRVYATLDEKERAIVAYVAEVHDTGQPILIGTHDVAESERLAGLLAKADIPCTVLNAKNDAREARIIAEAGTFGTVTVSTQMAGRGTDIKLGGAEQTDVDRVVALGGLHVVGTGRHVSRRLDQQLRGRSGRQGDPGRSVCFVSLEDEVIQYLPDVDVREFEADGDGRLHGPALSRLLDRAQRTADGAMLEIHLNTWRYTRIVADQRVLIDRWRDDLLRTDRALRDLEEPCADRLLDLRAVVEEPVLAEAARQIVLHHLDRCWSEHLAWLAEIREAIHLRALGRRMFPLDEFNREAIEAYESLQGKVIERSAVTFADAAIGPDGLDLDLAGLKRPTATWTYMVHDNPFGTELERILGNLFSKRRSRGE